MNEEIKEIKEILEYISLSSGNKEAIKGANKVLKCITDLQEENQKLNKIIDELEKWLKERINRYEYSTGNMNIAAAGTLKATLNKLTELKKEVE